MALHKVKAEFEKFGELLEKAQKNIHPGLGRLDDVAGTIPHAMQWQLKNVEQLSLRKYQGVLSDLLGDGDKER